jgi:hypothetical protein
MKNKINVFLLLVLSGCTKFQEFSPSFRTLNLFPSRYNINNCLVTPTNQLYFAYGKRWCCGLVALTDASFNTLKSDSIATGEISHLKQTNLGQLLAHGQNHTVYQQHSTNNTWTEVFRRGEAEFTGIEETDNQWIITSALNLANGQILQVNKQTLQLDTLTEYPNSFYGITRLTPNRLIVYGYGLILKSEDNGKSWAPTSLNGDIYKHACVIGSCAYIIGYFGSIYKSTDSGLTWFPISNGTPTTGLKMAKAHFVNEKQGYVIGENGLFMKTLDGGNSWQKSNAMTNQNLTSITNFKDSLLITGQKGTVLMVAK